MKILKKNSLVLAFIFTNLLWLTPRAFADYTVTGSFSYEDRRFDINGFTGIKQQRTIRYADVEIWSATGTATLLTTARVATDQNGVFSITVPGNVQQKIRARCYATSTIQPGLLLEVRQSSGQHANITDPAGSIWYYESDPISYSGQPTLDIGSIQVAATNSAASVFNIWDVMVDGAEFTAAVAGSFPTEKAIAVWSSGYTKQQSYYAGPSSNSSLKKKYFFIGSGYDDTVIYHQFGHFLADTYSKLDAPVVSADNFLPIIGDGNQDIRMAWAEGESIFLGSCIRQYKGYAQPEIYVITDGTNLIRSFEIKSLTYPSASPLTLGITKGSTNMLAVASALWGITNGPVLQRPFSDVWETIAAMKSITTPGISVEGFWDTWFSPAVNNGSPNEMQTVFTTRGIEFFADAQESDDSAAVAPVVSPAQLHPAIGPNVVINEIQVGNINVVELFNAGDSAIDITGWTLSAVASAPSGYVISTYTMPLCLLKPGGFAVLTEAPVISGSRLYPFTSKLPWTSGAEGACELRDSAGNAKDFVRWGSSRYPGSTGFSGTNPPAPSAGKTIGRDFNGTDSNSGSDWTEQALTLGTFNASGLEKHHTFYPAGDADYAAFNATAGRTYVIETVSLSNGADTVLELMASDGGSVLASNDDQGASRASRFLWTAPASAKYFVRCRRYPGQTNLARYGSYDLRILESPSLLGTSGAEILRVSKSGQGGAYTTIAEAVAVAGNGDTVQIIDSELYTENVAVIGKSLTLKAGPGQSPILDGGTTQPAIYLTGLKSARIDSLKITRGTVGILVSKANATIVNAIVIRATIDGIEVINAGTTATIVNSTIDNNTRLGLGIFTGASVRVANSILRDNRSADINSDSSTPSLTVKNSLVGTAPTAWNIIGQNGNITGDPKFAFPANDDFRLLPASPAIDKGDPNDPDLPSTDATGAPRSMAGSGGAAIPDMGAYEYYSIFSLTSVSVFPQMAIGGPPGGEYRTSIISINAATQPVIVNVSLANNDGLPLEVSASGVTGSSFQLVIGSGGATRLETTATSPAAPTVSGYVRFLSSAAMDGSALFKVIGDNRIISEAGVGLSKPTKNFTVYIDNLNNAWSGYAIANFGTSIANLSLTLRDKDGTSIKRLDFSLMPGQHIAEFAWQRFAEAPAAGFEGSIEVTSDQNIAAVALRYDNMHLDQSQQVFSTIPVLVDEAASTLYFPQAADGGGYRTNFILVNPGLAATTAHLEFFDDAGNPKELSIAGLNRLSYDIPLNPKGVARLITDGTAAAANVVWVKVTSPLPIGGSAIFQITTGGKIASEAGVASSPVANRLTSYASSVGDALSGLAICNPGSSPATITLQLRDTSGNIAITRQLSLAANGHIARFFSGEGQWFPSGFDDFEGTLEVISDRPVSAVGLRYDNMNLEASKQVFATIPVIIIQ